ncbi:glycosyltransferase WbsX family protein [Cytobacillus oceanisediminis]|uniref:glycosyltransferase WbsX family protein n=1 Tax=Cytobacillus oceanisediminis TaxID=665099 RepID=UPI001FB259B2|nr:glycoside hydrolase family 99-like domain-containing protein [Cytobacillus oceanisediminis]UOE55160.1 glycoside hydrolase family 99-like domain-containing protein [Cytobacillus oceanisediminis]
MTKVLAFFLPQFHQIPENDKWWGEGFTEWTNVKKSVPLFQNHQQPRIPEKENYYNLLDKDIQEWQSEIALKNGVGGFCYYHYWFNGKKLLEKPAEQMLDNKKITIPFCFSWANEPWTRAWDGKDKEILMPQEYGEEEDWEQHFEYLLPFFKDERYIKQGNKPLFLIYRLSSIKNHEGMLKYWNYRAKQEGFEGLHIISMLTSFDNKDANSENISGFVEFEPMYTIKHYLPLHTQGVRFAKKKILSKFNEKNSLDILEYKTVWDRILERQNHDLNGKKIYKGAFVGWDNSPRKGTKALIINDSNPMDFQKYFGAQLQKALNNNEEFLFINAWNEWAEGTYLEPDKKFGNAYLQVIKNELIKNGLFFN